jgi:uncharacterized protein YxeA
MKNILIGILLIAVIVLAYLQFKQKVETAISPSVQTTTVNKSTDKDYQPTPTNISKTQPSSGTTYTSTSDGFSLSLPANMNLADPDPMVAAYTTSRSYYVGYTRGTTPQLPYFRNIVVSSEPCSTGEVVNINGIQYIRIDETEGGMESASIDSVYCTVHNKKTYMIRFAWSYAKYTQNTPDRTTATAKFNNELTQLHFKFI